MTKKLLKLSKNAGTVQIFYFACKECKAEWADDDPIPTDHTCLKTSTCPNCDKLSGSARMRWGVRLVPSE